MCLFKWCASHSENIAVASARVRVLFRFVRALKFNDSFINRIQGSVSDCSSMQTSTESPSNDWRTLGWWSSAHPRRVVSYLFYVQPTRPAKFMSSESFAQWNALPALPSFTFILLINIIRSLHRIDIALGTVCALIIPDDNWLSLSHVVVIHCGCTWCSIKNEGRTSNEKIFYVIRRDERENKFRVSIEMKISSAGSPEFYAWL